MKRPNLTIQGILLGVVAIALPSCSQSRSDAQEQQANADSGSGTSSFDSAGLGSGAFTPRPASPLGTSGCTVGLGIVNGQLATEGDDIERSTVRVQLESSKTAINCTGTIIGPRHVLTASHCMDEAEPEKVYFGRNRDAPDHVIEVARFVKHPLYGKGKNKRLYDSSVILLLEEIPLKYRPAPLAKSDDLRPGVEVILAGFGRYSETDAIGERSLTWIQSELEIVDKDKAILETTFGNKKGSCYGDSGGPVFIIDPDTQCLKLAGSITSASTSGDGTCDQGGDLMMDVTRYQGWLRCAFEQMGAPLPGLSTDESFIDCAKNEVRQTKADKDREEKEKKDKEKEEKEKKEKEKEESLLPS